jgi:predicted nucleic-acid-binding Zn-ribbon protein
MTNQPAQHLLPPACPHCQSRRVWAEPHIETAGRHRQFRVIYAHEKPGTYFSGPMEIDVTAAICLNCGYTAFYARDVLKMHAEFENHPEKFDL